MSGQLWVILGTATTVATLLGVVGLFVLRAVIARDVKPLSDEMIKLGGSMKALTETLALQRVDARDQRSELHDAIEAIRDMLGKYQAQLGGHEARIMVLEHPTRRAS